MDKTVQTYLNEYISLIGKGKFMLFGGNDFVDAGGLPKVDDIEKAIKYYTMVDPSVAAGDVFNRILKTKAELEKEKGKQTDEQYTAFVAEWKTKQEFLVKALMAEFDRLEGLAKGAAASGAPGLFGGAFATPKEALIASAAISGVLGVVAATVYKGISDYFKGNPIDITIEFITDLFASYKIPIGDDLDIDKLLSDITKSGITYDAEFGNNVSNLVVDANNFLKELQKNKTIPSGEFGNSLASFIVDLNSAFSQIANKTYVIT